MIPEEATILTVLGVLFILLAVTQAFKFSKGAIAFGSHADTFLYQAESEEQFFFIPKVHMKITKPKQSCVILAPFPLWQVSPVRIGGTRSLF